ncbi:MAG TPA: hypothetical protein VFE50_20095 [Cyclobacteriaceae bacterium]|nr:hypothetical protein [Cyclobacteriaceae bacterium]
MRRAFVLLGTFQLVLLTAISALSQAKVGSSDVIDHWSHNLPEDSSYYTLPPYEYWDQQKWRDSVYRFPAFQEGRFEFANGFSPTTRLKMNYNSYLETIDIVEGDRITELKKFPELKVIYIGDHKFVYYPGLGYLEIILKGTLSLARKTVMSTVYEFSDGYRMPVAVIDDLRTTPNKSIRYYWPVDLYYVIDPLRRAHRPGPLLFPALVPDARHKIRDFIALNSIDYRNGKDLETLVTFCNNVYIEPSGKLSIPAASDLKYSLWRDSIYFFDEFEEVALTDINGQKEYLNANYNLETGWLDVIGKKNDTVALSTHKRVATVIIDGRTYMNHPVQGMIEIVFQGKVQLGLMKRIVFEGLYSNEKMYRIDNTWFFIKNERILLPSVKVVHSLFPKHKNEIDMYINAHDVNFRSKKDLIDLLSYCSRF